MNNNYELIEWAEYKTPDGRTYKFDDGSSRRTITIDGLGTAPFEYISERTRNGRNILGVRFDERVIQIFHSIKGCSRDEYWSNREDLVELMSPLRFAVFGRYCVPGTLTFYKSNGDCRAIKVVPANSLGFQSTSEWDEWCVEEEIRFTSQGEPFLFDPKPECCVIQGEELIGSPAELCFPIGFPIKFSEYSPTLTTRKCIEYCGSVNTYPSIKVKGPGTAIYIKNDSTGAVISLQHTFQRDSSVLIGLDPGNKFVETDQGVSIIGALSSDSTLATFSLEPDPYTPGGLNCLEFSVSGADENTKISLEYHNRYLGM